MRTLSYTMSWAVAALRAQVATLETRVRRLAAVLGLQRALLRVSAFSLGDARLPAGAAKTTVLSAVARARRTLPAHTRWCCYCMACPRV